MTRGFNWRWHIGAFVLYAALSIGFIDHGVSITHHIAGQGSDPYAFVWFLAWWPWALTHHVNPFFTTLVWQPVGVSLCWITSVPFLAILGWPITALVGPVVTYNLYIILAPILSALMAYLLCWRLTRDVAAALIGGFLFGFSAYEMAQNTAALNLSMTFCVPALLLVVLARLNNEINRQRAVILAGLILAMQFLICIEIFAMIFVFGGVSWILAVLYLPERRAALRRVVVDGLWTAPGVIILLLPFLFSMARNTGAIHHPDAWPYFFTVDFLNLWIPSKMNIFGWFFVPLSRHFNGGVQEQDAYLGLPLILLIWCFGREEGNTRRGRLLLANALIFLLMSFGPRLWIAGHYSPIVLPWMIAVHLPLLGEALSARFAMFVSLVAAIIAALWIANPGRREWRITLGVLACIALLPAPHPWHAIPRSAFFEPGRVEAALGKNPRILVLPFAINGPSSFWQQENNFGFTQTGGYLGFPPAPMQKFTAVGELFGNFMGPNFLYDFVRFCAATKTQYVVAGPETKPQIAKALNTLNWKAQKINNVTVFTVPPS